MRFTLLGLLVALVLPLPFILVYQGQTGWLLPTLVGIGLGWLGLIALMSQRVMVDATGVQVSYASWVPQGWVRGWQIPWSEITEIRSRPTSQGGRVHYLVDRRGAAFLLPMRIAGFAQFLRVVEAQTGLDTRRVKPLAQPWMYLTLLVCVVFLLLTDCWIIGVALSAPVAQ